MIYAEGGTHNGSHLLRFRRGAFVGDYAIQPYVQKFHSLVTCPTYDVLGFMDHNIILCLSPYTAFTVYKFPPFLPNQFMYDKYKDKFQDKWEIYAWALREALAKETGMPKSDMPFRSKLEYEAHFYEHVGQL